MEMENAIHRNIVLVSIVVAGVALVGRAIGYFFPSEQLITSSYVVFGFSFIAMLSSFALKLKESKRIRRIAKYSTILLPFIIIISTVFIYVFFSNNTIIIIASVILSLFTIISLSHIFLYANSGALTGNIVFIILFFVGIYFKRHHYPFAGWIITYSSAMLSIGNFMYGISCLYTADKINYLKNVSFSGCCILALAFIGQLFKMQHWDGAGILVIAGFAALILGSIFILLTLHSSGFIDWQPFYKKILLRILLPWIFIFILYIGRFMVPELNRLFWTPGLKTDKTIAPYGFGMSDYSIANKNGIDPK